MQLVDVALKVPKEMKEVGDLVLVLIADLKAKKSVSEMAGDVLQKLLAAMEGMQALGEEIKSPEAIQYVGLLGGQIAQVLMAPAAVAA